MRRFLISFFIFSLGLGAFIFPLKAELIHMQKIPGEDGFKKEYWVVRCNRDEFSDKRSCSITSQKTDYSFKQYNLYFIVLEGGEIFANINLEDDTFPGSKKLIRVDRNDPFELEHDGRFLLVGNSEIPPTHPELFNQLKNGKEAKIRWYKWPYENRPIDETISLIGLNVAVSTATKYLAGTLKYSLDSAVRIINTEATLMGTYYSELKACGKKSLAEKFVGTAKEITDAHPYIAENFLTSFETTKSIDPYGVLKGKTHCGTAEKDMKNGILKIEEVMSSLEK